MLARWKLTHNMELTEISQASLLIRPFRIVLLTWRILLTIDCPHRDPKRANRHERLEPSGDDDARDVRLRLEVHNRFATILCRELTRVP